MELNKSCLTFSLHQVRDAHFCSYITHSRHDWLARICLNKVLRILQGILASPFLFLPIGNTPGNGWVFPQTTFLFVIFAEGKHLEPFQKQRVLPPTLFTKNYLTSLKPIVIKFPYGRPFLIKTKTSELSSLKSYISLKGKRKPASFSDTPKMCQGICFNSWPCYIWQPRGLPLF